MVLTLQVPKNINEKLEKDKRRTGLSKSYLVRQILADHYGQEKTINVHSAA